MTDRTGGKPRVALLGTGIMGAGMARSMLRAALPVTVWNRTLTKAEPLRAEGAAVAATPAEAVADAQVIVTMLRDSHIVADTMASAAPGLHAGQVWAQTSTVGVAGLKPLTEFASENGLIFVDSPVVGTRQPAGQGKLIVLAAGPEEARSLAEPVFGAIGARTMWLGAPGTASRLKLVINSWVLSVTTAAAEALALARGLDLDPHLFLQTIAGGPLDSPYLQSKAKAILDGDLSPNFSVALADKDARLITEAASAAGVRMDVAMAVADRFGRAAALGYADKDMAATYFASFDDE